MKATTYLECENGEVRCDWTFSPVRPAFISGPPEKCYPAEGGELMDLIITDWHGEIRTSEWLISEIGIAAYERAEEEAFVAAEDDGPDPDWAREDRQEYEEDR